MWRQELSREYMASKVDDLSVWRKEHARANLHVMYLGRDEDNLAHSYVSPDNKYLAFLGRDGHIILLSKDTKQWIANMKMNGTVTAVDFSTDGRSMYSFGGRENSHIDQIKCLIHRAYRTFGS